MSEVIIQADNLVKIYKSTDIEVVALQGLDLTVEQGEMMAIIGSSGSGKSTFLNMLGGLDRPSAGKLYVDGKNLFSMTEKELVEYKRSTVGFVWQNNGRNLLPYLSAYENIMMPMELMSNKEKRERADMLLDLVGLSHKKNNRMQEMSGGEQQRIAIAIALANSPKVLLADEPTGSVDTKTSNHIFDIFRRMNQELGVTIVIVTHDVSLSKKVQRVAAIRDGKISSERILKEDFAERVKNTDTTLDWHEADSQDEFAILDKAGRIQLPRELLDAMELKSNKIRVLSENGRIILENPDKEE
ncbi:MAG: ABC transporter ATP-binding protein [Acetatifactor sp.]|jgi:ABC-type lipoprotein export system ATPase subunit|nr:ABC transporter ATP-binding protein [Acetatifactor sp.]